MLDVFVIAFIQCAAQSCVFAYPQPATAYLSYRECAVQLPAMRAPPAVDGKAPAGTEIACVKVPSRYVADQWVAVETTNLRKGPSSATEILGVVKRGTVFHAIAREGKWLCAALDDGTIGFLWADRAAKAPPGALAGAVAPPQTAPDSGNAAAATSEPSSTGPPAATGTRTAATRN